MRVIQKKLLQIFTRHNKNKKTFSTQVGFGDGLCGRLNLYQKVNLKKWIFKMIEVQNLEKKFGDFVAVDKINFSLQSGDILGFLGPNGAGKSTTMKILSGYLSPTSGTALVDSRDICTELEEVKKFIGYLPETVPLYKDMTVREFLKFIANIRQITSLETRLSEILKITFLEDVAEQIIGTLSKGYRQRVGFAQAIIHDPPVLILDEPTDGLDPNQKKEVRDIIKGLSKNKAIILSTHILEEMEAVCNRVVIINDGKIVMDSTPEKLLRQSPYYNNIHIYFKKSPPASLQKDIKTIIGIKKITVLNEKEFSIEPQEKENLFLKIMTLLKTKNIEVDGILQHRGKAEEVFRELTLNPK